MTSGRARGASAASVDSAAAKCETTNASPLPVLATVVRSRVWSGLARGDDGGGRSGVKRALECEMGAGEVVAAEVVHRGVKLARGESVGERTGLGSGAGVSGGCACPP